MGCMPRDGIGKYVDKRDWSGYNEKLVGRGEIYLSLDFLDNWDEELERMNEGKRGRPYEFPPAFIQFTGVLHILFLPYRQIEGFLRKLSQFVPQLRVADYTTIFKRLSGTEMSLKDTIRPSDESVVIAIDSSGIKVTNRGEWMREKWRRHRGWIKVHIAVNIETKEIVSIVITDDRTADHRVFRDLIEQAEENLGEGRIRKVLADGAYDTREAFNILEERGMEAGIKMRRNASTRSRCSPYRARCVRERNRIGEDAWKEQNGYGKRWMCETGFSSVKGIMGEHVVSVKRESMFKEAFLKFLFYNMLLNLQ